MSPRAYCALQCAVPAILSTLDRRGGSIRAVSARGRLAAWAREVQAAAPGWECSPRARHLCCTMLVSKQGARRAARAPCRGEGRRAMRQAKISSETVARN